MANIKNIRFFFNCLVVNEETLDLIRQAHERLAPPRSAPGTWPGTEFGMESEQGLALLGELGCLSTQWADVFGVRRLTTTGSPLGRSHGFFLIQHKARLGGSKAITKVRVFKNDAMTMPYMVFFVGGAEDEVLAGIRAKL